ncbi:MAG TPA: NPCBM/NEW2 domain-containing protein, partial [Planctomycetota bacterium]|nr:NPCBM/NEW2 domain-containing protein [Planctomycetota bacterium]
MTNGDQRRPKVFGIVALLLAVGCSTAMAIGGEAPPDVPAPDVPAPHGPDTLQNIPGHVTTIDGRSVEGDISAADATSLTVDTAQQPKRIKLADAIEINFADTKRLHTAGFQVLFLDGSGLNVDKIVSATEDSLKVNAASLGGDATLPLDHIMGVVFDVNAKKAGDYRNAIMTRQADHDFVLLPNQDSVAGKLNLPSWKDRTVTVDVDGQAREFKGEDAVGVRLQVLAEKVVPPALHVEVTLIDGSLLTGLLDGVDKGKLVVDVQGAKLGFLTGAIRSIHVVGSRMKYLSELEPSEKEEYPLLKSLPTAFPMHKNRTSAGKPILLNSKPYESGLGVHAYSHLTYSLNQQYEMFYTLVGIDDNMAKPGKIQYQVLVDGEVKKTGALSSHKADAVEVDVKGARKLELIVNFGDDNDQGDSVVWANARLIKKE